MSRLFPLRTDERVTLGKVAQGVPTVTRDTLMWLAVGDCAFRVRPVDGLHGRWGMARVAMPRYLELPARLALPAPDGGATEATEESAANLTEGYQGSTEEATSDQELRELVYACVKMVKGWRVWRGNFDKDGYPRVWVPRLRKVEGRWLGGHVAVHRLVCGWEGGGIPKGWTVDHVCGLKDCLDHLEAVTVGENTKRRHERERGERATGHGGLVPALRVAAGD